MGQPVFVIKHIILINIFIKKTLKYSNIITYELLNLSVLSLDRNSGVGFRMATIVYSE